MEDLRERLERGWTLEEHSGLGQWFISGSKEEFRDDERYLVSRESVMALEMEGVVRVEVVGGRTVGVLV